MAMSLAAAAASTRQCLSDVNPDGANPFIEKLLVQIYKHFDGQYLIDVTFKLSNPTALVTAHRLILSAASPYFKELFQSGAGICPLVEITDIDSDTFERLITFCYTGKTLITMDNVDRMLKAAIILQLDDAVVNCVDFLIEHITDYSLERAYALEREAQCDLLSEKILEYEIGNFMSGGKSRTIFQYNKTDDLWQKWVDIEIDITAIRAIFMDDNLIFIGGILNNKATNEVRSWNFKTKTFQQLSAMNQPRYSHCVVKLDDKIYAIGGYGVNVEILPSVEMYSVSNGWKSINSMTISRAVASAVVLNGKIYVIGGWNGKALKFVECYDPTTNCWTQCADMNEELYNRGAAVHNGQIFVVGGSNGTSSPSVERYDPQRNEWTKICSLGIGLSSPSCISIDNQLWAVGGFNPNYTNFVSVYNEQNNKWMEKKPMPIVGQYYCFSAPKSLLQRE